MKQLLKKMPMWLRYLINTFLFASLLIAGTVMIKSGTISNYES